MPVTVVAVYACEACGKIEVKTSNDVFLYDDWAAATDGWDISDNDTSLVCKACLDKERANDE